jgi:hypothetical protein
MASRMPKASCLSASHLASDRYRSGPALNAFLSSSTLACFCARISSAWLDAVSARSYSRSRNPSRNRYVSVASSLFASRSSAPRVRCLASSEWLTKR